MKSQSEKSKINGFNETMKYLGILMALLYVAAGIAILANPNNFFNISSTYAFPLGSMLIVYGLFRAYRTYQKIERN